MAKKTAKVGSIIRMHSKTFLKEFAENEIVNNFNYVVISAEISTNGSHNNAMKYSILMPPTHVMNYHISGEINEYVRSYMKYLIEPQPLLYLVTVVKACLAESMDIVLLCSKNEDEYQYLDFIGEFIEKNFKITTCDYETYLKDPEATKILKDRDATTEALDSVLRYLKTATDEVVEKELEKEKKEVKKEFKTMSKSELKEICDEHKLKYKKGMEKKDLIKLILKNMYKKED